MSWLRSRLVEVGLHQLVGDLLPVDLGDGAGAGGIGCWRSRRGGSSWATASRVAAIICSASEALVGRSRTSIWKPFWQVSHCTNSPISFMGIERDEEEGEPAAGVLVAVGPVAAAVGAVEGAGPDRPRPDPHPEDQQHGREVTLAAVSQAGSAASGSSSATIWVTSTLAAVMRSRQRRRSSAARFTLAASTSTSTASSSISSRIASSSARASA